MSVRPQLNLQPLPEVDLRHFFTLSDDTGILQHATYATANLHHGYCVDDVARALIAAVMAYALRNEPSEEQVKLQQDPLLLGTQRFLAFIAYAFNRDNKRFRNFMTFDRTWLEEVGSEDSHARTVWALGSTVRRAPNDSVLGAADELMRAAAPSAMTFKYLRPIAYSLLGLDEYLRAKPEEEWALALQERLARDLFSRWRHHASEQWPWWEDILTWGNAKLPHAMLVSGHHLEEDAMVEAALKALRWVVDIQTTEDGHISIIGNDGWFVRGSEPAQFDQQPLEAQGLVQACLTAAALTGAAPWLDDAVRAFEWFTGRNDLGVRIYNSDTGGCHDGLRANGVNSNQGAESTLAYLLSVLALHHYIRDEALEEDGVLP